MARQGRLVVTKRRLWIAGWEITRQMRGLVESRQRANLDATVWTQETDVFAPGRRGYGMVGEGFWSPGSAGSGAVLQGRQEETDVPVTIALTDGSVGSPARMIRSMVSTINLGAAHGELAAADFELSATDPVDVRGVIAYRDTTDAAVDGQAIDLGAGGVPAERKLYAVLHVTGGTEELTVRIQSSATADFAAPNERIVFTVVPDGTPRTAEWKDVDGPIAHRYVRARVEAAADRHVAVALALGRAA